MIYALPVLFAITIHEAAHGYAARHFGDNTAAMMGRITLNPIKHIDPIGTILMPLLLYFATSGAFLFGYAKPVPVRFDHLRHPKRDMIWVALAGPASNFVQAVFWGLLLIVLVGTGLQERFFLEMCRAGILVNLVMWAFNLFPLPPLDGGRILVGLLPWKQAQVLARVEPYGFFIVMALVIAGVVGSFWLRPLMSLGYSAIDLILYPFMALLR
nr:MULTISPECIES: site-2 protease family protein [unclassified Comamonas]